MLPGELRALAFEVVIIDSYVFRWLAEGQGDPVGLGRAAFGGALAMARLTGLYFCGGLNLSAGTRSLSGPRVMRRRIVPLFTAAVAVDLEEGDCALKLLGLAGEFLSTGGCGRLEGCYGEFAAGRKGEERGQSGDGELDGLGEIKGVSGGLDGEAVLTSRQRSEVELAVGGSGSFSLGAVCGESDFGGGDRGSGGIAKDALPGGGGRGLLSGCGAGDWQNGQGNQQEVCEKEGFGLHFGLAFDAVYGT